MTSIDVSAMLGPVSPEAPCGPDLSYDPAYLELERLARGTPEQQMGDAVREAEPPNWKAVRTKTLELLRRTRDLRLLVLLANAEAETEGLEGLAEVMGLLHGVLESGWDHVHPALDPDDGNDPMERINIVASLARADGPAATESDRPFVVRLREMPLTDSRQLGRYSLRDVAIASGEIPPLTGEGAAAPPDLATINAAFDDTEADRLLASSKAAETALEHIRRIDDFLTRTVGAASAPDLSELERTLAAVGGTLQEHLARRGYGAPAAGNPAGDAAPAAGPAPAVPGAIRSREDVLLALDRICQYYDAHEPSSPIPILLRRARRLASKSFVDIIKDLTPGALSEIETIGGERYGSPADP